jgi:hypothetical protein
MNGIREEQYFGIQTTVWLLILGLKHAAPQVNNHNDTMPLNTHATVCTRPASLFALAKYDPDEPLVIIFG